MTTRYRCPLCGNTIRLHVTPATAPGFGPTHEEHMSDRTDDPYTAEALEAAGWQRHRLVGPIGISGAFYRAGPDTPDDETFEVWTAPDPEPQ